MTVNPRHLMVIDRLTIALAPAVRFAPAWKRVLSCALLVNLPGLGLAGVADTGGFGDASPPRPRSVWRRRARP